MPVLIEAKAVSVTYPGTRQAAVSDVDLRVEAGSWVSLIGPNGCGKSTLLRAIAGLVPARGAIRVAGLVPPRVRGRRVFAQHVALVPQHPTWPAGMTVREYVMLGRQPYGWGTSNNEAAAQRAMHLTETQQLAERPIDALSGGQQQRCALARALAQEPEVLLLDEPTSALDVGSAQAVLERIDALRTSHRLTVLAAMHELTLTAQYSDLVVVMRGGAVVDVDTPALALSEQRVREVYGARVAVSGIGGRMVVAPVRRAD